MAYDDFRLLVEGAGGEYGVSVVASPAGETTAPEPVRWSEPGDRGTSEADLRRMGASLFEAFVSRRVRELYRTSIGCTMEQRRGLRLKLTIAAPELARAPWELLYDEEHRCFVGLSSRTPIVRHTRIPLPADPLRVEPPLRILGVVASPIAPNLPRLDVARERRLIDQALAEASRAGLVQVVWLEAGTRDALQEAMQRQGWHVFHFCGHGDYDPASGQGYLVLETEDCGPDRLTATDLGILLRGEGDVRLAVLNSCKGAAGDARESSFSSADALVQAGMGGVVAMQNPITDRAAVTFARVMYLGIASGHPVDAAVGSARVALKLAPTGPLEWWTPVLHLRARDGALFELPEAAAVERPRIKGDEYLEPDIDRRMEQVLARRSRIARAICGWLLAPIPLLAYLAATRVPSDRVTAEVEATAASFRLATPRELFSELPHVQSLGASKFGQVVLPGSAFPVRPPSGSEARVRAVAADSGSWISLQPWLLPAGTLITLDHPRGAERGEYAVTVSAGADRHLQATLARRIRLSRFGAPAEFADYGDTSSVELVTSAAPLELELRVPEAVGLLPALAIDSLLLERHGMGETGPLAEPTVIGARVRLDGLDTLVDATPLRLSGLRPATMDRIRLTDRGIRFTVTGSVEGITIGGRSLDLPPRLRWLEREHPSHLRIGLLAWVLILLALLVSWRTTHVSSATAK